MQQLPAEHWREQRQREPGSLLYTFHSGTLRIICFKEKKYSTWLSSYQENSPIVPKTSKHLHAATMRGTEVSRKSDRRNRYWPCPDGVFRLEYTLCRWLCNCFFIYWGPAEMPQELLWDYRETQVWLILPLPDLLIVSSCFYTGTSCKTSFEDKTC